MRLINGILFVDGQFIRAPLRTESGRIASVGEAEQLPGETVYDCKGHYVLPGFVDIHIHAYGGADCMRGEEDVRRMSRGLLSTGTAAFMPTTMSAGIQETNAALRGIQAVCDAQEAGGAAVLGAHMEAPFLNVSYKGAQRGECLLTPSPEAYEEMTAGTRCVRMMTLAPELPGAIGLIRMLKENGVVTCAAHSGATAEEVHVAADAGLTQITHLFNAQTPLHHRKPGVPGAGLADERLLVQMIADGIHLHPDVLRIAALCKGSRGVALISDSMEAAGLPEGEYDLGGQRVIVKDGAARLESGVLAGSTLVMHRALSNMIRLAHVKPEEAIPMATSTPADSVGATAYGRIKTGAAGIFALMDPEWNFAGAVDTRGKP
ncbi:MAG: N-acetylglucosamine-6-phosphate deacetylase [Clostridia bacterium]|nr:N-acetylglucosamine-6-phosphate deacetylase [Clostridia bacterium]